MFGFSSRQIFMFVLICAFVGAGYLFVDRVAMRMHAANST